MLLPAACTMVLLCSSVPVGHGSVTASQNTPSDPEIEALKWITGVKYWENLWRKATTGSLCEEMDNLNSHP